MLPRPEERPELSLREGELLRAGAALSREDRAGLTDSREELRAAGALRSAAGAVLVREFPRDSGVVRAAGSLLFTAGADERAGVSRVRTSGAVRALVAGLVSDLGAVLTVAGSTRRAGAAEPRDSVVLVRDDRGAL